MMRSFSLRRRIAALVASSVFTAVVMVGAAAWLFSRHYLLNQTDQNLINIARSGAADGSLFTPNGRGGYTVNPPAVTALSLPYQIDSTSGALLQRSQLAVDLPTDARDEAVAAGTRSEVLRSVTVAGKDYRMVTVPIPQPGSLSLQVGQDVSAQEESLHKLALLLVVLGFLGAAGAAALGVLIARAGLRPIRELTAAAERVAVTDELGPPIELSDSESRSDEVARLASSFNAMLAALAMSRDRQRALIADAGHELRTPLTSLRTNIELLAREDPASGRVLPPADRTRLLADLTAQTQELATLIGDLTDLAREDSTEAAYEDLDLAEVALRAVERVRRRSITVALITGLQPSPVRGRPLQLERAITNLLDNAVKWSPAYGEVYVGLTDGELVVVDQGPGISDEDVPHVFERFYRAATSREQPGSGLGLAIVAQAAQEHGGTVVAESAPNGGTLMRLTIPVIRPTTSTDDTELPLDPDRESVTAR